MGPLPQPGARHTAPLEGRDPVPGQAGSCFLGKARAHGHGGDRFPDLASASAWFDSPAYQALLPLREQAAEVDLIAYEE
jgi:hypothetical protein